jgi:SRSO17 transposase
MAGYLKRVHTIKWAFQAAGIPKENRSYKTKIELALDIVRHQVSIGTKIEFVGADGLYGNSYWFQQERDQLGLLFVLDVHKDQNVYTIPPTIYLPERQGQGTHPEQAPVVRIRSVVEKLRHEDPVIPRIMRGLGNGAYH